MKSKGTVYLVGAGPGDMGLLTLRASELMARADVVIYDALVNRDVLRLAPANAEIIFGGKRASDHAMPQDDLIKLLIKKAGQGRQVIRLKGGDPYIFGRGGEEAEALAKAGIEFEVVPGVSSVSAVANYAGIPITHRDVCSSYTVITGHEDPAKDDSLINWEEMAKVPGTKIILMGVGRIQQISERLVKGGAPSKTPVAMIQWGTTGRQRCLEGTLANIAKKVMDTGFKAPAIIIVGDVVKLRKKLNWFENRPLFGKRIVVTRTRQQASQLTKQFKELSAEVLEIPTIKIAPPDNLANLADAILELNSYNWIVFTSPNGVTSFFEHFFKGFDDLRDIGGVRFAAVGPATAAKLKDLHIKVDVMPSDYLASKVAKAINAYESVENLKILLLRAQVASRELPDELEKMRAIVDDVACYKTVPDTADTNGAVENLLENGADWITFTSGSTVENFNAQVNLPGLVKKFPKIKLASIGPETSKAIVALGLKPAVEAKPHTVEALVAAIQNS